MRMTSKPTIAQIPDLEALLNSSDVVVDASVKYTHEVKTLNVTTQAKTALVAVADKQFAAPARYRMWTCIAVVVAVLLAFVVSLAGTGWDAEKLSKLQWVFIAGFGVAGVTVVMTFRGRPPA
jgi:uncharacterized membrane protein YcjF (UPF0283 family)